MIERPLISERQRQAVDNLVGHRQQRDYYQRAADAEQRLVVKAVHRCLDANLTSSYIAHALGVTRQRVEQIRDNE